MGTKNLKIIPSTTRLPAAADFQANIIVAALLDQKAAKDMARLLPEEYFTGRWQPTAGAIIDLVAAGEPVGIASVVDRLISSKKLEGAGGAAFIASLTDSVPAAISVEHTARKIKQAALKCRLTKELQEAAAAVHTASDFSSALHAFDRLSVIKDDLASATDPQRQRFPDITPDACRVLGKLTKRPSDRPMLMTMDGRGVLPAQVVGVLGGTGGVSKSFLLLSLAYAASKGEKFPPFEFPRPLRILYFSQEDDQREVFTRLWDIAGGQEFSRNLYIAAFPGQCGPFMRLNDGNPEKTGVYNWFDKQLEAYRGLDLVVLDTQSRFNGLPENINEHGAAFMGALEALVQKHNLGILVVTHTNENSLQNPPERMNKTMFRGASAVIDNARIGFGLRTLTETKAKQFHIDDRRNYVELDSVKANYSTAFEHPVYFRRGDNGVLHPVNLYSERIHGMADFLVGILGDEDQEYSLRELKKGGTAKHIYEVMKEAYADKFRRDVDMTSAVDYAVRQGWITIAQVDSVRGDDKKRGKSKQVVRVLSTRHAVNPPKPENPV